MDRRRRKKQAKTCCSDEVSSVEWESVEMNEQEEDLIYRMYRLIGARWELIAGRIPGRKAEEIERFWLMRHGEGFGACYPLPLPRSTTTTAAPRFSSTTTTTLF